MFDDFMSQRLRALERSAANFRRVQSAALGAVVLLAVAGQAPAPRTFGNPSGAHTTISDDGVRVYDAQGTVRMYMGSSNLNLPVIREFDGSGKLRQDMALGSTGRPLVNQQDASGTLRTSINLADEGMANAMIYSAAGKDLAGFFESTSHEPNLMLYDGGGGQAGYFASSDGGGYFVLRDPSAQIRFAAGSFTDGSFGMLARSASNAVTWSAP
jgi:hypothetical protein